MKLSRPSFLVLQLLDRAIRLLLRELDLRLPKKYLLAAIHRKLLKLAFMYYRSMLRVRTSDRCTTLSRLCYYGSSQKPHPVPNVKKNVTLKKVTAFTAVITVQEKLQPICSEIKVSFRKNSWKVKLFRIEHAPRDLI